MAGSESEERIRAKCVEMMRLRWPEARIIHELPLSSGVIRIDVAAVGPDFLAVAEIKSDLDVLKRLKAQLDLSVAVADEVWLCAAPKHEEAIRAMQDDWRSEDMRSIRLSRVFYERATSDPFLQPDRYARQGMETFPDPRARFGMLWSPEMTRVLQPVGGGHGNMGVKTRNAVEWLSGGAIRQAVCAQLRTRPMARADPPVGPRGAALAEEPQGSLL